jgi:hypothetical protein
MKFQSLYSRLSLFLGIVAVAQMLQVNAGQYFQDFSGSSAGDTTFGATAQLVSTSLGNAAQVVDATYKELRLTDKTIGFTHSAFRLSDLDPNKAVYAFSAKWNAQINGDFPNSAADGFSFNFGQLSSLNLTNNSYFPESGYGTGLSFNVQTYAGNNPGFYIRVNGITYVSQANNPATQWGVNSSARHYFEVDWHYTNGMTVRVNGQTIFSNVPTHGFVPRAGDCFVWAARTGGLAETVQLDNIVVVTGGNLAQLPLGSPYYASYSGYPGHEADKAFDGNGSSYWLSVNSPWYIGASTSPARAAVVYALTSSIDTGSGAAPDPQTWSLEGSTNGSSWTSCGSGSGYFANRVETRAWLASNSTSYGAYRLNVSANNGSGAIALGELRAYAFTAVTGPVWQQLMGGTNWWLSIASSADGSIVLAGSEASYTWVYNYYASTWTEMDGFSPPKGPWPAVAIASGNKYAWAAAVKSTNLYFLPSAGESGPNWRTSDAGAQYWNCLASTADGQKMFASADGGRIWETDNAGFHWYEHTSSGFRSWRSIACTSDGSKLIGVVNSDGIYRSTNSGANWTLCTNLSKSWHSVASSADGTKLVACARVFGSGGIWTSSNSGLTWAQTTAGTFDWRSVASSADGTRLAAIEDNGVYRSVDSGATWFRISTNTALSWWAVACSADGNNVVAATLGGGIWRFDASEFFPAPTIVSQGSTSSGLTNATLIAQINPNRLASTAWFEWGTNSNYGNTIALPNPGSGSNAVTLQVLMTNLPVGTYHFRTVATNGAGVTYGAGATFSILPANAFISIALPSDNIVATSASSPAGQGAANATSRSASDKYLNFDMYNTGFTVQPSLTNHVVHALSLISAEDVQERDPTSYVLYGSNDGANFALIHSNDVPYFPYYNSLQSFSFVNTNTYSTYKVIFPTIRYDPNAGNFANCMQIAEVELLPYGDITSPSDTISLTLPSGASLTPEAGPGALLDRRLNDAFSKIIVLNSTSAVAALIVPAAGKSIAKGIQVIGGNDDTSSPGRAPSSVKLEGSNDGTNFTVLLNSPLSVPTVNLQMQGFSLLNNTNVFNQYRVTLGTPTSGDVLQLGEIRLFGISLPSITANRSGTNMVLSWPAASAGSFVLQQKSTLSASNWTDTTSSIVATNGQIQTLVSPATGANFYRLQFR